MEFFNTAGYLKHLAKETVREFDYRTLLESGDWTTWRHEFQSRLEQALGLPAIRRSAAGAPLSCRLEETVEFDTYIREKRFLLTEPGVEIPFYLLLPRDAPRPLPLVLTPHGHNKRGKEVYAGNYGSEAEQAEGEDGERDIALQAVAHGYAAIAPDVRGFNEMSRAEDFNGPIGSSCNELQRMALLHGRTLIGERVHDMGRLLDYAATRPEIDASRVAITGNSGGGTVSLFAAALDDRIKAAVPGSYFCTFFDSIVSVHHCVCNVVPGIMGMGEMYDVAGLIAPRPFLAVNGLEDPIFPIDATREAFGHLRRIYEALGYAERCELYEGNGGHRYYKARVWDFLREHL